MRPIVLTKTGVGSSGLAALDHYISPFNVGIGVVVSGTVNYSVQHTFDNIQDATVTPTWFTHPTLVSQAVNDDGTYNFPVMGVKVLINSGTGTATATVIQAGVA